MRLPGCFAAFFNQPLAFDARSLSKSHLVQFTLVARAGRRSGSSAWPSLGATACSGSLHPRGERRRRASGAPDPAQKCRQAMHLKAERAGMPEAAGLPAPGAPEEDSSAVEGRNALPEPDHGSACDGRRQDQDADARNFSPPGGVSGGVDCRYTRHSRGGATG